MKQIVKVGLVQMHCGPRAEDNLAQAEKRIGKLAKRGAQIICLPELFLTEYFCYTRNKKYFDFAEFIPGSFTYALGKIAKRYKIVLNTSIFERDKRGKFFNTAVVIDEKGRLAGKYRKMHVPDDPQNHYDEAFYFDKGDLGFRSIKTRYAAIGAFICFDQWFPEAARAAATAGAQILFYPTAIGWPISGKRGEFDKAEYEAWQIIQRGHAIANNVFVVAVNRVGREHKHRFWGSSFVSDPYGRIIAKASSDREEDLVAECDLSLIKKMRRDWPFISIF